MENKMITLLSEIKEDKELGKKVSASSDIVHDVGLDSLQMINFFLKIETDFGIEIDFENFDFSYLSSIKNLCEFLEKHQAKTAAGI
jgi:acyl carrier protein